MTTFEDRIWQHLVDHHRADRVDFPTPAPARRAARPRVAGAAVAAVLAAAVAAIVFALSASTSPTPAYALTRAADGSYRVALYDLSRGIPALNARFAQLGIRATAVPIVAGCSASSFEPEIGPGSTTESVTVRDSSIPPGTRVFIAAELLPNGRIALALGDTANPIPDCFPTRTSHGIPVPGQP